MIGEYFGQESQCLFGVVGSEVIDLGENLLVEFGKEFIEESGLEVFIGLSEGGCIMIRCTDGLELDGPLLGLETQCESIVCELSHGGDSELLVRSVLNLVGSLFGVHHV